MKHAIIVYGPPMSGKTTWIAKTGAYRIAEYETPDTGDDQAVDRLVRLVALADGKGVTFCCIEALTLHQELIDILEKNGWFVSYREFTR